MSKSELKCSECGEIRKHKKNCSSQKYLKCKYCRTRIPADIFKEHRSGCTKRTDNIKREKIIINREVQAEDLEE